MGAYISCILSKNVPETQANHRVVEHSDLAAEAILALSTKILYRSPKFRSSVGSLSGLAPDNERCKRMLMAAGLPEILRSDKHKVSASGDAFLSEETKKRIKVFRRESSDEESLENISLGSQDKKTRACEQFCDYLNQCLNIESLQLTEEGLANLSEYVAEILTNADDHTDGLWFLQGYMDHVDDEHYCDIAIFNFGPSIGHTLRNNSLSKDNGASYAALHYGNSDLEEEALYTVWALQERVSRLNDEKNPSETRGCGTADLVEFFQKVSEECTQGSGECAKMAILSGGTHILFDGTHFMQEDVHGQRKVIWFNRDNSPKMPPESKFVRSLQNGLRFPGTIISIRFPMNAVTKVEEENVN